NTAKSSFARTCGNIIDYSIEEPRAPSRNEDDYYLAFKDRYIGIVDNISHISPAQSDMYSRIATGGTYKKRKNYTDTDSVSITLVRPQIFTGINNCASRGDL